MLHSKMTKMDYVIEAVLIVIGAIVCICDSVPDPEYSGDFHQRGRTGAAA